MAVAIEQREFPTTAPGFMKANVFHGPGQFRIEEKPIPVPGYGEAVIKIRLTTICGTDIHIVKGEYAVRPGLIIGHEAVGTIHDLGPGVTGYEPGQRVLVGAITPCGQCEPCLGGDLSQCGGSVGGWRLGNTIDGTQAEYALIPYAQANLTVVPEGIRDEEVLLLADIASTGFGAAESANIQMGDTVAVFAQGPIGLCATLGAKLRGAAEIFAVDSDPHRLQTAKLFGATHTFLSSAQPVEMIREHTHGRGTDAAIEALGMQETFESALRVLRPGGTLSSVGVYSGHLRIPVDAFGAGLADQKIVTTLCPGGKERMRRLIHLVQARRINLAPLLTHTYPLDRIGEAYDLFAQRKDNVIKVAIQVE